MSTTDQMLTELAKANNFSDDDLAQNRAGKISDRQFRKLAFQALSPVLVSGGTLAGWLIFSWFIREFVPSILQYFIFQYAVAGYWAVTLGAVGSFLIGLAAVLIWQIFARLSVDLAQSQQQQNCARFN